MNAIMNLVKKEKVIEEKARLKQFIQRANDSADVDDLKENLDIAKGIFDALRCLELLAWEEINNVEKLLRVLKERYSNYLYTYLGESKKL